MSQNAKVNLLQKLEQTPAPNIATIPEVGDRFKHIYTVMNGGDEQRAQVKYEAERFHFIKLIQDKPDLQSCTKLSLYGCFLDMAVNGLSFDPAMKHAYMIAFNINVGTKQAPRWEKRASLLISGYGELAIRTRQGQIKHADNPILVYDGDSFSHGTRNGHVFLDHVAVFPRKSDDIIACYIRLERNDGSVDYKVLGIEEVMKIRKFSKDPNSKAWVDGLPGMIQAKTIKHAFRSYPKIRMGEFSQLSSNTVQAEESNGPVIDYGLNGDMPSQQLPEASGNYQPSMIVSPPDYQQEDDSSFVNQSAANAAPTQTYDDDNF